MHWICKYSLVFFRGACSETLKTLQVPRNENSWLQFLWDFSERLQQKSPESCIALILIDFNSEKALEKCLTHDASGHIKKNPIVEVTHPTLV